MADQRLIDINISNNLLGSDVQQNILNQFVSPIRSNDHFRYESCLAIDYSWVLVCRTNSSGDWPVELEHNFVSSYIQEKPAIGPPSKWAEGSLRTRTSTF